MDRIATNHLIEHLEIRAAARHMREAPRGFGTGAYLTAGRHERDLLGVLAAMLVIFGIAAVGLLDFGTVHPILAKVLAPLLH